MGALEDTTGATVTAYTATTDANGQATIKITSGDEQALEDDDGIRFPRLTMIDRKFAKYKVQNYNNDFTLEELCINFRNFAASRLHLYYTLPMIRIFIAGLSSTKLVILQGIWYW